MEIKPGAYNFELISRKRSMRPDSSILKPSEFKRISCQKRKSLIRYLKKTENKQTNIFNVFFKEF